MGSTTTAVQLHPDVRTALDRDHPVVALETAVVSAGLPTRAVAVSDTIFAALPAVASRAARDQWNHDAPLNIELARAMQRIVQAGGATPATIGLIDGVLHIGMDDALLCKLAQHAADAPPGDMTKVSSGTMAAAMMQQATAGTTVSATLLACRMAGRMTHHHAAQPQQRAIVDDAASLIRVFATGGLGGVHRQWVDHPDISADLIELARSPVAVVCSGCKSLLDVPATVEAMETLGIARIGYRTETFPQFYAEPDPAIAVTARVNDPEAFQGLCHLHWHTLGCSSAVVLCQPPPAEMQLDRTWVAEWNDQAERAANAANIGGADRTPFVLDRVAQLSQGRTLEANLALLLQNAALATEIACVA